MGKDKSIINPSVSLIIAFYNDPGNLKLILPSLELQTCPSFEVILADDGSSEEMVGEIQEMIRNSSLNIRHIWHEDRGWRKNIILNKAVVESRSDYLVFIDGDCILHPRCLEEHFHHKKKKWIIAGRRVNLSPGFSAGLTPERIRNGILWGWSLPALVWKNRKHENAHLENAFYFRNSFLRSRINKKDKGVLGSHFSLFREDLLAVNGFDERFLSPAVGEDTDLELRLRRNGMKVRTLKHIAIQYHLYHKKLPREKRNLGILEENNRKGITHTPYGIVK